MILPARNQFGTAAITVAVTDGDGISTAATFLFTVRSIIAPPSISGIADQVVNEDTSSALIGFTIRDAETPASSLIVSAHSFNPALVPDGNIILGGSDSNRTVRLLPAPDASGSAIISLKVTDSDSNSASITFKLTVNPVNDAPTLDAIGNLTVKADAGPQMVVLTGITSGAANEADTLSLSALSSNPAVIANPTIDYSSPNRFGILRFTPQANSNAAVTITVRVNDGGASNNLVSRSFTVTVMPLNSPPTIGLIPDRSVAEDVAAGPVAFVVGDTDTPLSNLIL